MPEVTDIHMTTLRAMAWRRVRGELEAMLETYWGTNPKFDKMKDAIEEFVKRVEKDELQY